MIFKSRQVNLDPEPWVTDDFGIRWDGTPAEMPGLSGHYDPRPEFEPTRDPLPWVSYGSDGLTEWRYPLQGPDSDVWLPRREKFDTPVNPILVAFRLIERSLRLEFAAVWAESLARYGAAASVGENAATPEQIEHALKVLTRLAAMEESK